MRAFVRRFAFAVLVAAAVSAPAAAQEGAETFSSRDTRDRLFAGPTGRTLDGGTGYVGVLELFFPNVTYGVTDRVQIGGGLPVIPEVALEAIYLTGKVGLVRTPNVALSAGTITFLAAEDGGAAIGALYGAGTFGDDRGGVTVGAGFPFFATGEDSEFADDAVLLVGGDWRVAGNAVLLAESYWVPGESSGVVGAGVRLHGERIAVDLGIGGVNDNRDVICCLPIVNVTYAFGGDR